MMDSKQIRKIFRDFFENKGHKIVDSDSMVIKGDPTLMFTNAGMNQFKDIFLGSRTPIATKLANSQKCLRVSGKHNDLEDVGQDTYHHTMFEMLGNWSFGEYFKEEGIAYAWELLTEVFKIDKDRLYITVFGGDEKENLLVDSESEDIWRKIVPADKIVYGSRKDNFWEMGEMGPCGPCTEIHIDLRTDEEISKIPGRDLVNMDHNHVIEIWNIVFIQYNRKADGIMEDLPQKHVDTGMGFERLCAVLQGKKSNYDTDLFQTLINKITEISGKKYDVDHTVDVALRVVSDHLRAVAFAIADGQLPSNVKAGYVIRRILRRAVRYAYSVLDVKEPLMYKLVDTLTELMGDSFPELVSQNELITKVIKEEEIVFLRTLDKGINLLDNEIAKVKQSKKTEIGGNEAFILYDTYGFPFDLTELISREQGLSVNKPDFDVEMKKQKDRARNAAEVDTDDWTIIRDSKDCEFVGYDSLNVDVNITRYRKVTQKTGALYHLVFDKTPFYAEAGGQVGDKGFIEYDDKKISIINTINEHNLIIHIVKDLPADLDASFKAVVSLEKRMSVSNNHTATHLLHSALKSVLGEHVEQKGSLVDSERIRFDFTHFEKLTNEDIRKVELIVNAKIRENILKDEKRGMKISEAKDMGAIALFGEKYGENVRVIKFDESIELCGGTHVESTGQIGFFKITAETGVAAGIRRVEAITGKVSEKMIFAQIDMLSEISTELSKPKNLLQTLENLVSENSVLKKKLDAYRINELKVLKKQLIADAEKKDEISLIFANPELGSSADLKEICSQIRGELKSFVCVLGTVIDNKPYIAIAFSDNLIQEKELHAGKLIGAAAKLIQGGGGGQAFVATAGGKKPAGINDAIEFAKKEILGKL